MKKLPILFFLFITSSYSQISGCTDVLAKNYDANATENDGSCVYTFTKIKSESSTMLSDTLKETSGLVAFNDLFWTHNDDHDTTIYGLNSAGKIQRKINLKNVNNQDWEEIAVDSSYIYIGDFGNNFKGNRTDLQILRIEKKSFLENKALIDTISFSYSNQTNFSKQKPNKTDFDCEAFVVSKDSIYLFTKQWSQKKSNVYVLPKTPGKYSARLKNTLRPKGLITGATLTAKNEIVLCGYTKSLKTWLYLITDLKQFRFSKANHRNIKIALPFHQIEGIASKNGKIYLTNESFIKKPFLNNRQAMHTFDLSNYLK